MTVRSEAFEVGSAYLRHDPLERLARPVLARLVEQTGRVADELRARHRMILAPMPNPDGVDGGDDFLGEVGFFLQGLAGGFCREVAGADVRCRKVPRADACALDDPIVGGLDAIGGKAFGQGHSGGG